MKTFHKFYLFSLFCLVFIFEGPAFASGFQDGCYQMYQKTNSGVNDYGVICLQGLYEEGVGQNLRIVTGYSGQQKHFCGRSNNFSVKTTGNITKLTITLLNPPNGVIEFAGTGTEGSLSVGKLVTNYLFIPSASSASLFSQCEK